MREFDVYELLELDKHETTDNIACKTLGLMRLIQSFSPAPAFAMSDRGAARNPILMLLKPLQNIKIRSINIQQKS